MDELKEICMKKDNKTGIQGIIIALLLSAAFVFATAVPQSTVDASMKLKNVHKGTKLSSCKSCHHKPGSKKCGGCHSSASMRKKLHEKCKGCHKSNKKAELGKYLNAGSKCKQCHK